MESNLINRTRNNEQSKALNKWANSGFIGSIIAGTGFGKSKCGILACNYVLTNVIDSKMLILVPTVQLQQQFQDEFHKWGLGNCLVNLDILCYQSAYKIKGNHYDLVLCDEIHLGLSKNHRKFFENNTWDKLLCMTATLPEEEEYRELLNTLAPPIYTITLDECVDKGIVAPYSIYCKKVVLTDTEQSNYKAINNKFLYYKYQLGQFDAFDEAKRILGDINAAPREKQAAVQFYKAIRDRKTVVDFAENKITAFQDLYLDNIDKQILVFSGANEFTDKLCDSIFPNAVSYHSKKTKKQKESALKDFIDGTKNVLCSTKALNQGFDAPNATMGVICGITSKSLSMIQRVGRLIRFKEGKIGQIYILYVENSQEEKWLKASIKSLNNVTWLP
jgi:superfamily II DNA or RNA helicase